MAGFEEHAVMSFITKYVFDAYFEEAQMALLNFFVLFLPNAHHFPSLFRFAKKMAWL